MNSIGSGWQCDALPLETGFGGDWMLVDFCPRNFYSSRPVRRYSPELFAIFHARRAIARSTISPIIWV
jgi:hypothetical protein